jgi:hypothetical protein
MVCPSTHFVRSGPFFLGGANGFALIAAMIAILFVSALAAGVIVIVSSETVIAANHRQGIEALYAAEAMAEWTVHELDSTADWDPVRSGELRSSFADGAPAGTRRTADALIVDPDEAVNVANCGHLAPCSPSEITGNATGDRPWGSANPVWHLFAYGPISALLPSGSVHSPLYVLSMVAGHPSNGHVIMLRAGAIGPQETRRSVQLSVSRPIGSHHAPELPAAPSRPLRVVSWHVVQ